MGVLTLNEFKEWMQREGHITHYDAPALYLLSRFASKIELVEKEMGSVLVLTPAICDSTGKEIEEIEWSAGDSFLFFAPLCEWLMTLLWQHKDELWAVLNEK